MLKARVFSLCFQLFIWIPDLSDKFCKLNKYKTQISILIDKISIFIDIFIDKLLFL